MKIQMNRAQKNLTTKPRTGLRTFGRRLLPLLPCGVVFGYLTAVANPWATGISTGLVVITALDDLTRHR